MSQQDIDRLLGERKLAEQQFDDTEVVGFWSKAITAFDETQVTGISTDTKLQIAYRACLQSALAVLAVRGLRPKSTAGHYVTFYALQKLDEEKLRAIAVRFDELRTTRAESIYEPGEDEAVLRRELANAMDALELGIPIMRALIVSARPGLDAVLPRLPEHR